MGYHVRYTCAKCGSEQVAHVHRLRVYCTDGGPVALQARLAWCNTCLGLVAAEDPVDANDFQAYAAALRSDSEAILSLARVFRRTPEDVVSRKLAEYQRGVVMWSARRSAPRCLVCGSEDVAFVGPRGDWPAEVEHPGCGGTFLREGGSFVSEDTVATFDPEGRHTEYASWSELRRRFDYP